MTTERGWPGRATLIAERGSDRLLNALAQRLEGTAA
jgi:hypothetical protein